MNWFQLFIRKEFISLKRNFYVIPLIFITLTMIIFTCNLHVSSPTFSRVEGNYGTDFNCLFIFIVTLMSIMSFVSYFYYMNSKKLFMLIIFFATMLIQLGFVIFLITQLNAFIIVERAKLETETLPAQIEIINRYINLELKTRSLFIAHCIFNVISCLIAAVAPFIQKVLKKVKIKRLDTQNEANF